MQDGDNARPGAQYHSLENHHKGRLPKEANLSGQSAHESGAYVQYED